MARMARVKVRDLNDEGVHDMLMKTKYQQYAAKLREDGVDGESLIDSGLVNFEYLTKEIKMKRMQAKGFMKLITKWKRQEGFVTNFITIVNSSAANDPIASAGHRPPTRILSNGALLPPPTPTSPDEVALDTMRKSRLVGDIGRIILSFLPPCSQCGIHVECLGLNNEDIHVSACRNCMADLPDLAKFNLLVSSIQAKSFNSVNTCLKFNIDPNVHVSGLDTPLYTAVENDDLEIVKLLLQHSANPNKMSNGWSPSRCAFDRNNYLCLKELLKGGANARKCMHYVSWAEDYEKEALRKMIEPYYQKQFFFH